MSEERFVDSEADDFERSLIVSGRRDGMGPSQKRALALALAAGAGAATLTMTSVAGGAAKAGTVVAAKTKSALGVAALAKWIAGIAVASVVVAGAGKGALHVYESNVASRTDAAHTHAGTKVVVPAATAPLPPPVVAPARAPVPEREPAAEPAIALAPIDVSELPAPRASQPVAVAPPRPQSTPLAPSPRGPSRAVLDTPTPPSAGEPAPAAAATPSPLAEELRAIDLARRALANGDTNEAGRALDAHAARFPSGALSDEARVLRIDVLVKQGNRKGAESAARAFLASSPRSPHAPRLRVLLGEAP